MLLKTVNVTNPRNVLVQIPSYVVRLLRLNAGSVLEVHYDDKTGEVTIKPSLHGRSDTT